jgi:hypothetical protein
VPVAGFNYGVFKKEETSDSATNYQIEGYAAHEVPDILRGVAGDNLTPSRLIGKAIVETQNSMRLFTHWFGASPYGRIAITQQAEANYGQSWPGLVYLPVISFLDSTERFQMMGLNSKVTDFIQEVTPHEVAHQWWGHIVGWASFHDQWISEGFSDFSASLYVQATEPKKFVTFWEKQRDAILEKNEFGKRANDAGPLWMGLRLNGYRTPGAYSKLVYPKGSYVLHMLRALMRDGKTGDQPFISMMHQFVETHKHKNASTDSFQAVVERHMTPSMNLEGNGRMDWFFRQWVYGMEVPKYEFTYKVEQGSGNNWKLSGSLTQGKVSKDFMMSVPLYVDFDGAMIRIGLLHAKGNGSSPFNVELPRKPRRAAINLNLEVLAEK